MEYINSERPRPKLHLKKSGFSNLRNRIVSRKSVKKTPELQSTERFEPITPDGQTIMPASANSSFNGSINTPSTPFNQCFPSEDVRYLQTPVSSDKRNKHKAKASSQASRTVSPLFTTNTPMILSSPYSAASAKLFSAPETRNQDNTCVFCDLSFNIKFNDEQYRQLDCGHYTHFACLQQLVNTCLQYGDQIIICPICDATTDLINTEELIEGPKWAVPTVGIDEASVMEEPDFVGKKLEPLNIRDSIISSVASTIPDSPSSVYSSPAFARSRPGSRVTSLQSVESTHSLVNNVNNATQGSQYSSGISRAGSADNSATLSDFQRFSFRSSDTMPDSPTSTLDPMSYRRDVIKMFDEEFADVVFCGDCTRPLKLISHSVPVDENNSKCVVGLYAPKSPLETGLMKYYLTSKDISEALEHKSKIADLPFNRRKLSDVQLGTLRLVTEVDILACDSDDVILSHVDAYLFKNYIVFVKDDKIKTVVDIKTELESYEQLSLDNTKLAFSFKNPALPCFDVEFKCAGAIILWKHALSKPDAHFPVIPSAEYLEDIESRYLNEPTTTQVSRAPAEVILCLPIGRKPDNLLVEQCILETVTSMEPFDKMGLVLYSNDGIIKEVPVKPAAKGTWNTIIAELNIPAYTCDSAGNSPTTSNSSNVYDLNSVLEKAASLLENHNVMESSASIVLVCDGDFKIREIPDVFHDTQTPIHVVGTTKRHNATKLNVVAKSGRGSYYYAHSFHTVQKYVRNLIVTECRYILKDVSLKLKPRIGTKFKKYCGSRDIAVSDDRELTWNIGKIRAGDTFFLTLDIEGSTKSTMPLIRVTMSANNILNSISSSQVNTHTFKVESKAPNKEADNQVLSLIETEECLHDAESTLDSIMLPLLSDHVRPAYHQLNKVMEEVKSRLDSDHIIEESERAVLGRIENEFDDICDIIISRDRSTNEILSQILHTYWLLKTRRSLIPKSSLEASLHYEI